MLYLVKSDNKCLKQTIGGRQMIAKMIETLTWYEKIKVLRTMKKWDQKQAGDACFTHAKNYWLWETGKSYPTYANRKLIAKAFGVTVEYIFLPTNKVVETLKVNNKEVIIIKELAFNIRGGINNGQI